MRFAPTCRWLGNRLIALISSRSVVVVSTTCAILYSGLWVVGMLQANGLVSTALPISVADEVILRRSGARLGQATPSPSELQQRERALASAQRAADSDSSGSSPDVTLEVQTSPPVELWVLDSSDQATGVSPETQLVRLQLPGSAYSGKGSNPQLVSIPHAGGQYRVQLWSTQNTHFELRVRAFSNGHVDSAREYAGQGEVFQNSVLESLVTISADSSADDPTLDVGPAQVLLATPQLAAGPQPSQTPESQVEAAQAEPSSSSSAQPSSEAVSPADTAPVPVLPPARPAAPPAVFRPQPQPSLPIPLPVVPLPAAPVAQD
ncbi:MAG TPA: hypothetical protein VK009_25370 [Chloroflexota bacterium]|nr:hypothetical protein [Chloroflexota bacterium]